ncbi:MAG TPA: Ig-like domain-containing protein, partial [candidate division Zixibacteria bacterium]|nr:Ig-like domain-containing protein [candidate division Zixibacteria bacterium]
MIRKLSSIIFLASLYSTAIGQDLGAPDSLKLVLKVPPVVGSNVPVVVECSVYVDANTLGSISFGWDWDNSDLQLDSAKAMGAFDALEIGPFFFLDDVLQTTNDSQVAICSGVALSTGFPPAAGWRHIATYYGHVTNWTGASTLSIDTAFLPAFQSTEYAFTTFLGGEVYLPHWNGALSIGPSGTVINYTDGSPYLPWLLPQGTGETSIMAMRFTNPNAFPCTLKAVTVGLIDDLNIANDIGGDLLVAIFSVDATGLPVTLIYYDSIPNSEFVSGFSEPLNLVQVDVSAQALVYGPGAEWAIGVTSASDGIVSVSKLSFASDSGAKPTQRWYEYGAAKGWALANCCHGGIDVNMHIYSTISGPPVNNPPVLLDVVDIFINEGDLLEFSVTANDPDPGDYVTMTMESPNLPADAFYNQQGNYSGFGIFSWATDIIDAGSYDAIFIATDIAGETDADTIKIIVTNVNQPPVLKATPDQFVDENQILSFDISANDFDGDLIFLSMTSTNLPQTAFFTDNGDGTGTLQWNTNYFDAGTYTAAFKASDATSDSNEDTVSISVNNIEQPPVFAPIGDWQVNESGLLTIPVSATDSDDDPIQLEVLSTNIDSGSYSFNLARSEASGTFVWQTDFADSGNYFVVFGAFDGKQLSTDSINIVVTNILCADIAVSSFSLSGIQSVSKGPNLFNRLTLNLTNNGETDGIDSVFIGVYISADSIITTSDQLLNGGREHIGPIVLNDIVNTPVGGVIPFAFPNGPAYLGIVLDENQTSFECNEANNTAFIPVNVVLNNFPVLNPIPDTTINEGQPLTLNISGFDTDMEPFIFEASNLPTGSSFNDNGDGSATFDFTPGFDQAGIYNVTFRIVDQREGNDEQVVRIVVNNVNQEPFFEPLPDQFVSEGQNLSFIVSAQDLDDDAITLTCLSPDIPIEASFVDSGGGLGVFSWTPGFLDAEFYTAYFTANDGKGGMAVDTVAITVFNANRDPLFVSITDTTVDEGQPLHFVIYGADSDGDPLTFFLEGSNISSPFTFVDSGNDSAVFDWTPTFDDAGPYSLLIYLDDGQGGVVEINISINVNNVNRPPALVELGDFLRTEGDTVLFPVIAFDPDFDNLVLSIIRSDLPASAVFADSGFGAGIFNWPTTIGDAGTYYAIFEADDLNGEKDQDSVNFFITSTNLPPVFDPIGDKEVFEDQQLVFTVSVTDPNDDFPSIEMIAPTLPNATFQEDGDVPRGDFSLFATSADIGVHQVIFRADDLNGGTDEDTIFITVKDFNFPPAFFATPDTTISENDSLVLAISAYDEDGDPIVLTIFSTDISGGGLIDNGDGTGSFNWRPIYSDQGIHTIIFRATSTGGLFVDDTVQITVLNVNQAPVLVEIDNYTIAEGDTLAFDVFATDVDGDFVTLKVTSEPPSSSILDQIGNGLGTFYWMPGFFESGFYTFTFTADDGFGGVDVDSAYFIVTNANQPPVLTSIGTQLFTEGNNKIFVIEAFDPDGTIPTVTASDLPSGADLEFGDAPFVTWTPGFNQAGDYFVTFYATDEFEAVDSEVVLFRVSNVNRPPQLNPLNDTVIAENQPLHLTVTAFDPDGESVFLGTFSQPSGSILADNGDGSGSFDWTPSFDQSGNYLAEFVVSDGSEDVNVDSVIIIVTDVNRAPELEPIGGKFTFENDSLSFFVNGFDADGGSIELTMVNTDLPPEAQFYQILNKDTSYQAGLFVWAPTFGDSGVYTATFVARDGELADSETISITVSNVACTDLDVFNFTLNGPQQISAGKPFQARLNLSLQNLGPIPVDSSFTLSFYLSDDSLLDGLGQEQHLGLESIASLT